MSSLVGDQLRQIETLIFSELKIGATAMTRMLYRIGRALYFEARPLFNGDGDRFVEWVESLDLPVKTRTLYHWMRVARHYPNLEDNEAAFLNIQKCAFYHLAGGDVPEEARKEALQRAEAGEKVTVRVAEEIAAKHMPVQAELVLEEEAGERAKIVAAQETKRTRVANDYYPTDDRITQALTARVPIEGTVLEPCAGHGFIAAHFEECVTNEPYPGEDFIPDMRCDASSAAFWDAIAAQGGCDWVVTNPPYGENLPSKILPHAFATARVGVAFLLRLNFLEPCRDRGRWLEENASHLSDLIIFSPRPSFRDDTGKSDSVTVAWFVWQHDNQSGCKMHFVDNWKKIPGVELQG